MTERPKSTTSTGKLRRRAFCAAFAWGVPLAHAGSYDDFFIAVRRDNAAAVAALLRRGFDPDARDPDGQVGLFVALRAGSLKVVEVLLEHPATDVDAVNDAGETPLMMAALRGYLDWCRRLVARGARIERDGWSPLHYAASGPNVRVVEWLVEQRAPLEALSPNGTTALMMAAGYGADASAQFLLERGANRRARNQRGWNAADFARAAGRDKLAARLDPR